jgi:hypothetical protein
VAVGAEREESAKILKAKLEGRNKILRSNILFAQVFDVENNM